MFKTKTHNAYIIMINKDSYIKKKSHNDSIRIIMTQKDCKTLKNLYFYAIMIKNVRS